LSAAHVQQEIYRAARPPRRQAIVTIMRLAGEQEGGARAARSWLRREQIPSVKRGRVILVDRLDIAAEGGLR